MTSARRDFRGEGGGERPGGCHALAWLNVTPRLGPSTLVGALLFGSPLACGLVDQSGADGAITIGTRWLFLQDEDALTLVEFDDPRAPHVDARAPLPGSFRWSAGAERSLVLGETAEATWLVQAPAWEPSALPEPEFFNWAYFLTPDHFLAGRGVGIDGEEWVFRDLAGNALGRWGFVDAVHSVSASGAFVAIHGEDLTLVRRDLTTVVLRGPGLNWDGLQAYFDDAGEHALIATWAEDAVDFGPLPDFVAHVEMEASPSCLDEWDCDRSIEPYPKRLARSGMMAAEGVWMTSTAYAARLLSVPLGEKTTLPAPELTDPHFLASWDQGAGVVRIDGPSGRVRFVQTDHDKQTWSVDERDALDKSSDWHRIAEGSGRSIIYFHADFDLLWLSDESGYSALDLATDRPPHAVGPSGPYSQSWERRTLFLDDASTPCQRACKYVAYADPSDPEAPALRGTFDALHRDDYLLRDADSQWAPDQSGLLLRSDGWLYYHAFAEPDVRFRLAPLADDTRIEVPPVW